MGSAFEFIVPDETGSGEAMIDAAIEEVKRIERLLTEFSETSQTSLINKCSGIRPVEVDPEVYNIIKRSKKISTITQGAAIRRSVVGMVRSTANFF